MLHKTVFGTFFLSALYMVAGLNAQTDSIASIPAHLRPAYESLSDVDVERDNELWKRNSVLQNASMNRLLGWIAGSSDENSLGSLIILSDDQKTAMKKLNEELIADLEKIDEIPPDKLREISGLVGRNDGQIKGSLKDDIRKEYNRRSCEILLHSQLETLESADLRRFGLAKVVTESFVGDVLEVTEMQKERIRERAEALAKKIEEFNKEMRQESVDLILDELDSEQRKRVLDLYEAASIESIYSERMAFDRLYQYNKYRLPEGSPKSGFTFPDFTVKAGK
jgi:cell division septum initiation protein DivIVA